MDTRFPAKTPWRLPAKTPPARVGVDGQPVFTILSSYYSRESKALLEFNRELVAERNPGLTLSWVVADNTPSDYAGEKLRDARFTVVPGARELEPKHIVDYHGGKTPSCEHGVVLNNFHTHVKSRFALIVDNDFFIVRKNWIRDVMEHMDENKLAFFGSPFHPRQYHKLRYFPCPQLFFIDTNAVAMSSLDFLPQCDYGKTDHRGLIHSVPRERGRARGSFVRRIARRILGAPNKYEYRYSPFSIRERGMVEGSRDTGTSIVEQYRDHPSIRSECLQPTWKPWRDGGRGPAHYAINMLIEFFLPDRLCFVPKRAGYFTTRGFKDRGYFDVQGLDTWWEELVWKNEPFGFHLRQNRSVLNRDVGETVALVQNIVRHFTL